MIMLFYPLDAGHHKVPGVALSMYWELLSLYMIFTAYKLNKKHIKQTDMIAVPVKNHSF